MKRLITYFVCGSLVLLLALLVGCSKKSTSSLAPFQPQITNMPDDFQFQATGVENVTTTEQYVWQNTGTSANVNQSCAITSGSATLTIYDNDTVQVYSQSLTANGTYATSVGTTGSWLIRVQLTNCYGTLNFRAQKP
ncbi:MAG: hypothetical protein RBG1_1C00001G1408 [candidate division Zixibacteria bacterium RBG-1]|nr:MAG: hypothetical protein RBG1_1C00001G1408 [candidate division Zixibacteria bacterium RBG-1]